MLNLKQLYTVFVKCITFNHQAYIIDAMNGFCIQKTNFPYVCIIVDDASIDGEQDVIQKYFQEHFNVSETNETNDYVMHFGHHKTNEKCYFIIMYLKYNHYSIKKSKVQYYASLQNKAKYIALCEGDDYWIDENKLQVQVDFLEENKEYGMCYTNFNLLDQKTNRISNNHFFQKKLQFNPECYDLGEWIVSLGYKAPMTWLYKRETFDNYIPLNSCDGTFVMVAHLLANTKIKCLINKTTAVYRKLEESASHSTDLTKNYKREINLFEVQKKLIKQYNLSENIKIQCENKFYTEKWKLFIAMNDKKRINEALIIEKNIIKKMLLAFGKYKFFSIFFSRLYIVLVKIKKNITINNPNF